MFTKQHVARLLSFTGRVCMSMQVSRDMQRGPQAVLLDDDAYIKVVADKARSQRLGKS